MRRLGRWLLVAVALLALLVVLGVAGFLVVYPRTGDIPPLDTTPTPERLARGEYLARHVTVCIDCHSPGQEERWSAPPVEAQLGAGGQHFGREMGLPGSITAPNITPASLGDASDGELARAIACGVDTRGRSMFPVMPYVEYNHLAPDDLAAILAWLRQLEPVESPAPPRELDFPVGIIARMIPRPWPAEAAPDPRDPVAHGGYLARIAGCHFCHSTTDERGHRLEGMDYAGGRPFPLPGGGTLRAPNITPDPTHGIGRLSRDSFVELFLAHADSVAPVAPGRANTEMPWALYAGMERSDLEAIHAHLLSRPAIDHEVTVWEDASPGR